MFTAFHHFDNLSTTDSQGYGFLPAGGSERIVGAK
jgi:hypothetical protein